MTARIRYYIACFLFDTAARVYPLTVKQTGQAHYVGNRWLTWTIGGAR